MKYIKKAIIHPSDSGQYSEIEIIKKERKKSTLKKIGAVHIEIDHNALKNITFELSDEEIGKIHYRDNNKIIAKDKFITYK
ncbi:hypothetical protein [Leptospira interrogans]|uniref:Uncharacterized protein n=1 Tax=Leptospira interrogans serovar Canicola TaxID=211880 RepID=A0AAP9WFB4_LEPIR|nr:hypothetical protein [Leptospira interrogans]EMN73303.1 hypothetical protein LEP1GSC100_0390 [Leptospira interrogans serovar Bataviae str. UI 08561]QOI45027.1 hypothetical protein Lepto782_22795 [Leptospira interrogans serovar Canicola]